MTEEPAVDALAMLAESSEQISEAYEEEPAAEAVDGFEALAASSEDGFESLARASLMEEAGEAESRSSATRKVKPRKIKVPKFKRLKKKHSIASLLIQKSKASSVFGGILGGIVAIYSCAIVFAPLSNMVKIIADARVAEDAVDILATAVNEDVGALFDNAFVKSDKKPDNYPKVFEISENFSLRPEDFTEVFDTANDSIAHYVYKYSGADFVATSIYNELPETGYRAKKTVLAVGRLIRQKGFDMLLKSWKPVEKKHPDWNLRIVGDGEEKDNLLEEADRLGLKNVEFAGQTKDVERYYQNADFFVLSSRNEGFAMVVLEAMGHGLPVVAFDCKAGVRETVADGFNGYLVPLGNIKALARRMDKLISDEDKCRDFGKNAMMTSNLFSPSKILDELLMIIMTLSPR